MIKLSIYLSSLRNRNNQCIKRTGKILCVFILGSMSNVGGNGISSTFIIEPHFVNYKFYPRYVVSYLK